MSDLKKDIAEIEAFFNTPSPLGAFKRKDEPYYKVLKSDVEYTGRVLAKAEYVANMRKIEHFVATAKLNAFVNGEELPRDKFDEIEANIANFITELKKGVWN